MSYFSRYDRGDWKAICDVCGRELKASLLQKRWDGLMVCQKDWEPRHPQDFVRGVADTQTPMWTRPKSSDSFIPFAYTQALEDTVGFTYSSGNYLLTYSDYFASDYLYNVFFSEILFESIFLRTYTDTTTVLDTLKLSIGKSLADTTTNTDSAVRAVGKSLTDSSTHSESGSILSLDYYVSLDYFLTNDYVGTIVGTF